MCGIFSPFCVFFPCPPPVLPVGAGISFVGPASRTTLGANAGSPHHPHVVHELLDHLDANTSANERGFTKEKKMLKQDRESCCGEQ